ncbi:hypothetical protein ACOMHN_050027 [Nucella lapillus]
MSKKRKTSNVKFYAVTKGRKTGIFTTWNEASDSVTGFHGAAHKSYGSLYKAKEAMKISGHSDPVVYGDEYKEETVSEVSDMSDEEHEKKSAQETEKEQTESFENIDSNAKVDHGKNNSLSSDVMESCEPQTPTFTGKLTPDNLFIDTPERTTMEDDSSGTMTKNNKDSLEEGGLI